jgi:adenine-specific DNA-methyltransferase
MPSELDVLLNKVADPALRADLRAQVERIRAKRTFGLVFEAHLPERVRLPEHPLRPGVTVTLRDNSESPGFEVLRVRGKTATIRKVQHPDGTPLSEKEQAEVEDEQHPTASLVVLADFGDPIFPGLRSLGRIERGGDKPAHVVIKGENHHVLEALQFTHAGKVDCIYIDPPYNSGARDWKYDNNYVDDSDAYRHSKWLAFIERRILLAKQLLNPDDSVLIVSIDEKEYLRLGMLLEQTFPAARITMVSSLVNPAIVARGGSFGRGDEYIYFVMFGTAAPQRLRLSREWVSSRGRTHTGNVRWDLLRRSGPNARRVDRPKLFYAIYVDPTGPRIVGAGDPLPSGVSIAPERSGCVTLLPIRQDRSEGNWQVQPATLMSRVKEGRVRVTGTAAKGFTVSMLKNGEFEKIRRGEFEVTGTRPDGSLIVADSESDEVLAVPGSQWRITSHDATQYGTRLLADLLPGRGFPFPKSLYAVEDAIRFFVSSKPEATVLDFFGGSGTTTHAVARLNHGDGGHRRSILITNNEVSAEESDALRKRGVRPGDPEWEELGIFAHVTRPRIEAAITGQTMAGKPVRGGYKFADEFPMSDGFDENVEFLELTYLDANDVELDRAFAGIAPLLWLRAGGIGPVITECLDAAGHRKPYAWTNSYGVLFNPDRWRSFVEKLPATATTVFIVTDSQTTFAGVAAELPESLDVVRLYENYLTTFAISGGFV